MKLIPLGHRILVKPQRVEDTDQLYKSAKAAGIELLEYEIRKEQVAMDKGTVLDIGPTAFKDFGVEPWCQIGDLVAYARHGGKMIQDPDSKEILLLLNDEDLICKLVEEDTNE